MKDSNENALGLAIALLSIEPEFQSARAILQKSINSPDEKTAENAIWELRIRPTIGVHFVPQLKSISRQQERSEEFREFLEFSIADIESPPDPGE